MGMPGAHGFAGKGVTVFLDVVFQGVCVLWWESMESKRLCDGNLFLPVVFRGGPIKLQM